MRNESDLRFLQRKADQTRYFLDDDGTKRLRRFVPTTRGMIEEIVLTVYPNERHRLEVEMKASLSREVEEIRKPTLDDVMLLTEDVDAMRKLDEMGAPSIHHTVRDSFETALYEEIRVNYPAFIMQADNQIERLNAFRTRLTKYQEKSSTP